MITVKDRSLLNRGTPSSHTRTQNRFTLSPCASPVGQVISPLAASICAPAG